MNIYFDTEDNSPELLRAGKSGFGKRVTQICAVTDGDEWFLDASPRKFLAWLSLYRSCKPVVWAHNLQYDLGNLFADELDKLNVTMVGGRLIRAEWGPITFQDSYNLWPMNLKSIGAAFGLEKGQMDVRSEAYVRRDVEILRAAIQHVGAFVAEIGGDRIPATLGSLTVAAWQHFGGENFHESSPMSKAGFFGGRVELFRWGLQTSGMLGGPCERIQHVDVNSLYPFAMMQRFPACASPIDSIECDGVVDATVTVPEQPYCPLPVRLEYGRVCYPWGRMRGVWTTVELREAVRAHDAKLVKIHCGLGDPGKEENAPYRDFMTLCYERRLRATTEAQKLFWKLLMNNLYGRLCVSGRISRSVKLSEENKSSGTPYGTKNLLTYNMPLPETTNYLHAAWVTGLGRVRLLEYMRKIRPEAMIYCDTDSLVYHGTTPGSSKLVGEMKHEGTYETACCYVPKGYRFGTTYKAKGVPKAKAREFLEEGKTAFDLPFRMRESIAFFDRLWEEEPDTMKRKLSVWRTVEKEFSAVYDRKEKRGDGRYHPYTMKHFQARLVAPEY
jgi:hypothetical protein